MSKPKNDIKTYQYVIAIGSNIEPDKNTKLALDILQREQKLLDLSRFRKTPPVGYQAQDDFLNGAVYVESSLAGQEFRLYLKDLEKRLGRVKGPIKSGPRTIDLDIIIINGNIIDNDYYTANYIRDPVQEIVTRANIKLSGI